MAHSFRVFRNAIVEEISLSNHASQEGENKERSREQESHQVPTSVSQFFQSPHLQTTYLFINLPVNLSTDECVSKSSPLNT